MFSPAIGPAGNLQLQAIGVLIAAAPGVFGRERLDWPLALLSMDLPVWIFLSGPALGQLPARHTNPGAHDLPRWQRLWSAAEELGAIIYISDEDYAAWQLQQPMLAITLQPVGVHELAQLQAQCRHLLHV